MYLEHFQLKTKPFQITADPKFLWLGEKHKEALATLRYGILDNRGFLLLTGEVGTGKTLLINRLITMLDMDTAVATLPDPDLTSMDFYNILADGFKMNRTFDSKGVFLLHLRDFLHKSYAEQKQVLLIIDESQRLNHRLMEDIRVLSNIELQDRKLINIFFVGQQEFNTILTAPQNRALAQRITVRYHITPLDKKEVGQYIQHRLSVAGASQKIFNSSAIEEVFQFSGGIPRLINILCDHALLTAYARNSRTVDAAIVKECAQELRIPIKSGVKGMVATMNSPDSKSATDAAAKSAAVGESQPAAVKENSDSAKPAQPPGEMEKRSGRSPLLKIFYACIVLSLVVMGGYAITQMTSTQRPKYDAEDLTPQQYRTTLEKEKELLSRRLAKEAGAEAAPAPAGQAASSSDKAGPAAALPKSPSGQEGKTIRPASQGSDVQGIGEIEPLPLMKEKIMVHFNLNSNEIEEQAYPLLDRIAAYLIQQPDKVVHVRGYTDASGAESYNESVSRFRASVVKTYLVGKGAPADNIVIHAMGSANPIAANDTSEGRRQNRRVEIVFPDANNTPNR